MRLFGALGGLEDDELRATFNGGLGMIAVLPRAAVATGDRRVRRARHRRARSSARCVDAACARWRALRGRAAGVDRMSDAGAIAVGVSGAGSNLRALHAAAARGELGGEIVLVFADRACPALDWAAEQGIDTALVPDGDDAALAETLAGAGPMSSCWPATCGSSGRRSWPPTAAASSTPIRRCCRRSRARTPCATRWRTASTVTGVTVHLVDATLDGGPIVAQEAVADPARRRRGEPARRGSGPSSIGCCRGSSALLLAGAVARGRRRPARDHRPRARRRARPGAAPRAPVRLGQDRVSWSSGRGLVARGFELVSTGGTARTLRDAGLPVTDVAAVTGSPEMLDGRVKTLHPRVHGGLLADRRLDDHRRQLLGAGIAPFELVVVNLYPFAAALERPGITIDELIEEIDIGGPSMVRAAAKNHANVAIVTSPARYDAVLAALDGDGRARRRLPPRAGARGVRPHRRLRRADRGGAAGPVRGRPGLLDAPDDPYPPTLTIALEKVETLRYGENPHQPAARYRRPGHDARRRARSGSSAPPLQGKALSYNNVLDAAAASALGRALRGPGVVIVKHTNPCGAAERPTLLEAWAAALEADPVSAFGGVVALTREVDRAMAEALTSIFLEIVVAPAFTEEALEVLATKPNLRVLVDEALASDEPSAAGGRIPIGSIRTAGGAVLVTTPDVVADDPTTWTCATRRAPTDEEQLDLDLAWRLVRGVTSNAIVLVRDRRLVGMGSGQTSRVDAARQAVAKAHAMLGATSTVGAACASRCVLPVPRRGRGVPRGRRARLRPARRLGARRRGRRRRSTRPAARCSSPGPATSATDRGAPRLTRRRHVPHHRAMVRLGSSMAMPGRPRSGRS